MEHAYPNPILSGFYPDPSICRVGEDYYLVNSTFAYFPGIPIHHSKDLIHWEQIGNVLNRKEQLPLTGAEHSGGIYAPTIRYHKGTFYCITTNVGNGGNFIVTAKDPAGPWSDPYYLPNAPGIDPSLFFDEDDTCYYCGTTARREGSKFFGDNEIYVQKLDLHTMTLIGESYPIWHGALQNAVWPEGPHIYKKDDYYYLIIAEGGTGYNHAITIARSKDIFTPFEGCPANPIVTHRHLGRNYPIQNVGHGDLIETDQGDWYMVLLASRPYGGGFTNLGRETFLAPITWENGWPIVNYGVGVIEDKITMANIKEVSNPLVPEIEDFYDQVLSPRFLFLRNPNLSSYSLSERKGYLTMTLSKDTLCDISSPTYVGIRQTGMNFILKTRLEFFPEDDNECAGLAVVQSNQYNYQFISTLMNGKAILQLIQCIKGNRTILHTAELKYFNTLSASSIEGKFVHLQPIYLKIEALQQNLTFSYSYNDIIYHLLLSEVDASILSTEVAGGFVGNTLGLYCSSNGEESKNRCYFDWLYYKDI